MSKKQSKDVTICGGVNVAPESSPSKSTTKNDTAEPEEKNSPASVPPEEPTE